MSAAFDYVALQCAPRIAIETLRPVVAAESSGNVFAIGVVGGRLERQPRNLAEAVATARELKRLGYRFSAGIGQIYIGNWTRLGLDEVKVFDACANLRATEAVLSGCYSRAKATTSEEQVALQRAISCYHSNNFTTGFSVGYVQRVVSIATRSRAASPAEPQPAERQSKGDPS